MVIMTKAEAIARDEWRRAHVPLYNDQKLKLGVFSINCSNGVNISHAPTTLSDHLGAPARDRPARRCDGLRARAAGGALARLRRHHRLQRRIVRDLHLGGGAGAGDQEHHGRRDQPRADHPSDRRRQAGDHHRPHLQRPLRPQPGDGLVHARDGRCSTAPSARTTTATATAPNGSTIVKRLWTEEEPFDFETADFHIRQAQAHPKPIQKPLSGADQRRPFAGRDRVLRPRGRLLASSATTASTRCARSPGACATRRATITAATSASAPRRWWCAARPRPRRRPPIAASSSTATGWRPTIS